jgi:hypothetical protein
MNVSKRTYGQTFRDDLKKIMPGYSWTVHRHSKDSLHITATGTQSSGFNRTSTVEVIQSTISGNVSYTVKTAGYGKRAPTWLDKNTDTTLARAFRGLQDHYERKAGVYNSHAASLRKGRREIAEVQS